MVRLGRDISGLLILLIRLPIWKADYEKNQIMGRHICSKKNIPDVWYDSCSQVSDNITVIVVHPH